MGFFSSVGRNYKNAGAKVWLFVYVVKSYDAPRENWPDPLFNWQCTGLELHKYATTVKKQFLKALNKNAAENRKSIQLPADYWRLATRMIIDNLNRKGGLPPELYENTRDCMCLVAEAATEQFNDGDSIGIVITESGETWVDIMSKVDPLDFKRTRLGTIQRNPTST